MLIYVNICKQWLEALETIDDEPAPLVASALDKAFEDDEKKLLDILERFKPEALILRIKTSKGDYKI